MEKQEQEAVSVIGLGFVGLTAALGFAHYGRQVYGFDANEVRRQQLKNGIVPFHEPGLPEALSNYLGNSFVVSEDIASCVQKSGCIFFCVGTPCGETGEADLTDLFAAFDELLPYINFQNPPVFVIKSTVPPGTTANSVKPFLIKKGLRPENIRLANNPEFLREGHCWEDFLHADRVVIGTDDPLTADKLEYLYEPFKVPVIRVSPNTGEFIKYLSNTLLATLISFSNEMEQAAHAIGGIETAKAFRALHMDKRWANGQMASYAYPGCGYGGYCLPKDTKAMLAAAKRHGAAPSILQAGILQNEAMPAYIADRIQECVSPDQTVGILGLSFKPGSDDVRDAPSGRIIRLLMDRGYTGVIAYDPIASDQFQRSYKFPIGYCGSLEEICEKADCLVILTAWEAFAGLQKRVAKPVLDFRYMETETGTKGNHGL